MFNHSPRHLKNVEDKKMFSKSTEFNELKGWTLPIYHTGSECYISFTAFCPTTGKMRRKRIMLDHIKSKRLQKAKAQWMIQRITDKLLDGWNPWVEAEHPAEYTLWEEVCSKYEAYIIKMSNENGFRAETLASYMSYLKILKEWSRDKIHYAYQFDRKTVGRFLDYVFVDRNNTLQTRNNYLSWLKTFSKYLINRSYVPKDPTEGYASLSRNIRKNRDTLSSSDLKRLRGYLEKNNKHYLLACYILYYTFLRPHEMSCIKIEDIRIKQQTISVSGQNAKNHNDAVVTLPQKVIHLMIDLDIFSYPGSYYLFSRNFAPGQEYRSEKSFRDFWHHYVRKALGFHERYKFYSLKDTGITNMLRNNIDSVSVRDQARHSSIQITNIYVPQDMKTANKALIHYEDEF